MILRIFKAVWFLSLLAWLVIFLYVYASLPERVFILEGEAAFSISREVLFYSFLGVIALFNVLVFIVSRLFNRGSEDFLSWFYGLIICLNFFFVIVLNFLSLISSSEKFDYSRIGYVIYGSLGLVVGWAISWPFYSLSRKILNKQEL
jgi:hypothetical protein